MSDGEITLYTDSSAAVGVFTPTSRLKITNDKIVTENKVGIKEPTPGSSLHVSGVDGIIVPIGTTSDRTATQGMIRYNTDTTKFEGYTGSTWVDFH